jgi:hypothetical protein
MNKWIAIGFALAIGALQPAIAQQQQGGTVKVAQAGDSGCRKEVKDYLSTLSLLRETAGSQVGNTVADAYLSEGEVEKIVQAQGHCAAAQQLRDKRVRR